MYNEEYDVVGNEKGPQALGWVEKAGAATGERPVGPGGSAWGGLELG